MKIILGLMLIFAPLITQAGLILKIESRNAVILDYDTLEETIATDAIFGWSVDAETGSIFDAFLRYNGKTIGENGVGSLNWTPSTGYLFIGDGGLTFSNGVSFGIYEVWTSFSLEKSPYEVIRDSNRAPATYGYFSDDGRPLFMIAASGSSSVSVVSVPEPATLSLLALGLAAIGIRRRYS